MAYATIDKPSSYFNTQTYTGTGSNNITLTMDNIGLVWIKNRGATGNNNLFDIIRGGNGVGGNKPILISNSTAAEQGTDITATGGISFGSTTTTIGSDNGGYNYNTSSSTYVSWFWGANGSGSSNTSGSITSTVSANTTSGFSIVSYTGNGSNSTIGHGLGVAPAMVIIKDRDSVTDWSVNHQPLCTSLSDYSRYMTLNSTSAVSGAGNTHYQNTAFTSTVFNVGTSTYTNNNTKKYIAYCFANVKGFSKIGLYTGNGSTDGTFVYTGFTPSFILTKCSSTDNGSTYWCIFDNKREGYNGANDRIFPNVSNAESNDSPSEMDILSNGFKIRGVSSSHNISGQTFIYMAFAENPFVSSKGLPVTAR